MTDDDNKKASAGATKAVENYMVNNNDKYNHNYQHLALMLN